MYNEIIIQLTIMQNQWEPWACFPATIWSHLGVMGDSETRSVLLMSSLLRWCSLIVTCHSLIEFWYEFASDWFIMVSVQSNLSANDNLYLQLLPSANITASAPPQITRHKILIKRVQPRALTCTVTVGLELLWESNATFDLTRGRAQVVMWVMGSSCKYRWSLACSLFTSCCVVWLLTDMYQSMARGLGTPALHHMSSGKFKYNNERQLYIY